MGLTNQSTGMAVKETELIIQRTNAQDKVVALAGNPNVGKSTVFNALTGMNQHTGNWPGKTVSNAQGTYQHHDRSFILVDIPGTYSLMASSVEEEVARDFICFGERDMVVVVADATCMERNLNLVLQILEVTRNVVLCVNLLDEAKKKKIEIDFEELEIRLGIPVVGASARAGQGLSELKDAVEEVSLGKAGTYHMVTRYADCIEDAIAVICPMVAQLVGDRLDARFLSIRLLERDVSFCKALATYLGEDITQSERLSPLLTQAQEQLTHSGMTKETVRDSVVETIVKKAEDIFGACVQYHKEGYSGGTRKLDKFLTSKLTGIPVMIGLLAVIFWLTITGANYPSAALSSLFMFLEGKLGELFAVLNAPAWLTGLLVEGMFRTLGWVVSVMLPPMAIFFPLFTLLEDSGYLPRIAFNMDKFFRSANAHGKQALTMCMGFGCNACGVIGCRIIDSPRERLIAILTNNFVPCNGRFPTLIAIITMFFAGTLGGGASFVSTAILTAVILFGIMMTLFVSKILSKTLLKGIPSSFALELPPYRRPQVGKVIVRSIFDRTLFVLGRAIAVAAPAGLIIWILANWTVGDRSLLLHCAGFLDPFAQLIGLDGIILFAFILGFPANEIVMPIIIMSYLATGSMIEYDSLSQLHMILVDNGWTWLTALCTMLFSLLHFPCATTCLTIRKETKSLRWTAASILIPTAVGITICFLVTSGVRLLGLV